MDIKKYILIFTTVLLLLSFGSCERRDNANVAKEVIMLPEPAEDTITPSPQPEIEPELEPSPSPEPSSVSTPVLVQAQSTMWGDKFPGKFTSGEIIQKHNIYMSKNVCVILKTVQEKNLTYHFADIYIADIKYFISPFSDGEYNRGQRKFVYNIARETGAVIAVNGDYYSENDGPVLRDGILYRNEVKCDILIMFRDGTMKTYSNDEYDEEFIEAIKDDVWQIWTFGPMLLKDGQPMTEFDFSKNVGGINPRTAIGYFEPGHYAFVTVDGRQPGYSDGLDMQGLSMLMYELGCSVAFNLDGGGTAQMAFLGEEANKPSVHRKTRDALCIIDEPVFDELFQ